MEQSIDIVEHISKLLDAGKYKESINVSSEQNYEGTFKDNCWDLISVVIGKIQDETIVIKPSLYGACEELLTIIIQKVLPEEGLLEFIEQIELAKNDAQLSIILTPLQQLLHKVTTKKERFLEWCFNSIFTYIKNIPTPEYQLDAKERLLLDSEPNVRRIIKVYAMLPSFYSTFKSELSTQPNVRTKQIMNAFLISLLGKPLIFVDMDPESSAKSEAWECCNIIMQDICILENNILKFLDYLEICYKAKQKSKSKNEDNEEGMCPYDHRDKLNITTLSGLYYAAFSGHFILPENSIPYVYSTEYVVNTLLLSVVHLLDFTEYGPLSKGLVLCEAILKRLAGNVSHTLLASTIHFDLCKTLSNVAIYSTYQSIRKNALNLLGCHINKYDYKGRCMLIKYLIGVANHSGMIGYAITLYKNSIDEAFKDPVLPECFTGTHLLHMIKRICFLPYGEESDLVELADQIISSLNLLRYLVLKDTKNVTGIQDCFSTIQSDYLNKLRTGLNMSKAHYEVKLKDIEEEKNLLEDSANVTINVGGNMLDKIPTENKKEIIHSALNAFHLIEGLIARLSECINTYKQNPDLM
ncbi:glomulin-like isoform X1 [Achroia grisella]|uniref:glomulin-like isoform X1 n=1 Tax=Achroia grisella TaxID=688607 RepID=UPI0027D2B6FB|nr:glomulin-like isoform X1 [Achroia grisella]